MTTTQTITASYDAYVSQDQPKMNFGDQASLHLWLGERRTFLYFPIDIPTGATVLSAALKLTLHGAWAGTNTVTVYRVTQEWKEGKVTWDSQPNVNVTGGVVDYDIVNGALGDVVLIPIPVIVQAWVNGSARYGVRLHVDKDALRTLYASEDPHPTYRPQLLVSWGLPPDPPTNLRPGGSRVVATGKPILMWDSATPSQTQVQIRTVADTAATPEYDSGWQANDETQWDLGATGAYGAPFTAAQQLYTWDNNRSDTDPGNGKLRANNDRPSQVTKLFADWLQQTGADATPWQDALTATNDQLKGQSVITIHLSDTNYLDGSHYVDLAFTLLETAGGYRKINVAFVGFGIQGDDWFNGGTTIAVTGRSGLPEGATRYWRSRIIDDSGIASDWSDVAQFTYRSQGVLAITAPASDGADVLSTTPTITHAFTGRVQQNTEYLLYEAGRLIYHRDKQVDTETSFVVPHGLIRSPDVDYEIVVRVWDTYTREANGTAPDYVEASRVFALAFSGTVSPIENLAVIAQSGRVSVSFTRPTQPSYFALWVDDELVLDRLDPADLSVGGTAYQLAFYRAPPQVSHTYKVLAVQDIGGTMKLSDNNPSTSLTWKPQGIWLVDEDTRSEVELVGDDPLETPIGESGETFMPLGSGEARGRVVRIIDSIRGYEGTLSATIIAIPGQDADDAKASFNAIKVGNAGSVRLIYGFRNFPVVLGEASFSLVDRGEESYAVTVDFWQISDWEA